MSAYYNENNRYAAAWLRNLIADGLIPDGRVDDRSIADVDPTDLSGYTHVHLFAGIAGWALAARLAGWPDSRPLFTGSAPCQPFSVAGKGGGIDDPRHLWPHMFRIASALRPPVIMGEQVAGTAGYGWLDGVQADLETQGYTCEAVDIPAGSVNAPHIRNRLYWLAHPASARAGAGLCETDPLGYRHGTAGDSGPGGALPEWLGNPGGARLPLPEPEDLPGTRWREEGGAAPESGSARNRGHGFWDDWTLVGPDPQGKYRRVKPGVRLLASGIPSRVAKLRALGNAIVPPLAEQVIRAYMETHS